jgi:hypothetical protein
MKLLDLYKSMMRTAGLIVTEDNLVSGQLAETVMPITLKGGRRLALPSQAILARPDKSDIVVFHPLMEQVTRGESEILEKYRKMLMIHLNQVAATQMLKLLTLSASVAEHKHLTPDQSEFLTKVKNVDDKTIATFEKVIGAMPHDQIVKRIITLFLKKTGSVAGKRYKRVGVVHFPLYDELKKAEHDIYGVKCRVKDKEAILALLEYIFPNIQEVGSYNRGSDSDIAANVDALMQSVLAIVSALNSVTETFEDVFSRNEDANELMIDVDWQSAFMNLGSMMNEIRMVPMQAGNEGATDEGNKPEAMPVQSVGAVYTGPGVQTQAAPVQAAVVVPAAQPSAAPTVVTTAPAAAVPTHETKTAVATGQPLDSFLAQRENERNVRQQMERGWQAVTHQQPQQQQPAYNPAMTFVPPQQQQMQYMAPPPMVNTGRGLDFASVMAHNPAMAYATGGPVGGMYPVQPQGPQTSRFFQNWNAPGAMGAPMPQQQGYYQPQMGMQPQGYYQPQMGMQPMGMQRMI